MNLSKTIYTAATALFLAFSSSSYAGGDFYLDLSNLSHEHLEELTEDPPHFGLIIKVDGIKKSDIEHGFYKDDSVEFAEAEGVLGINLYYDSCIEEAVMATLNYTMTKIEWEHNPWFSQNRFDTFGMSVGAATKRFNHWYWRGQFDINIDAEHWDWDYTYYDITAWGRYEYSPSIGLHVGAIVETGINLNHVVPIIGVDWQISDRWRAAFVFPMDISLTYLFNDCFSVSLAQRIFNSRHRAGKDECHNGSLISYENMGTELAFTYENCMMLANIHAGYAYRGMVRIANRHNHHAHHYELESSPYAGAEVLIRF